MSKKSDSQRKPATAADNKPNLKLKDIGGSKSDLWNKALGMQALNSLWIEHSDERILDRQQSATLAALAGIAPKDELESMMAAQLLAAHNAAMECYRRAMIGEQTFEGRSENLSQANKLSRTYATLLEALNRHRGKGQQKVTVEHVHVHAGGQAVVGMIEPSAGGDCENPEDRVHAKQIAYEPEPALQSKDEVGEAMPIAGNVERALPNARRQVTRRSEG